MRKVLLFILLNLACLSVWAQMKEVTGRVVSKADGEPLAGVNVIIKGSSRGTQTDGEGRFAIKAETGSTLVFTSLGFKDFEVKVSGSTINVTMVADEKQLQEVVVVGFGTQIKQNVTGSIAKVTSKEIENLPVNSMESAIQGRAAGVFVQQENGKLGQGIKVRVRGSSSITAGSQPLYVIDGIPMITDDFSSSTAPTNPMADLNANDIESVEILKDAGAAAIYGSRASNGVVLISTKKGKAGKTKVNFSTFFGLSEPTGTMKFMNSEEFVNYTRQAAVGGGIYDYRMGVTGYGSEQEAIDDYMDFAESRLTRYSAGNKDYETYKVNTDWQSEAFQRAPMSSYNISLNGGNEKTTFYIGGGYNKQDGILINNAFELASGRLNIDHSLNQKVKIGTNIYVANSLNKRLSDDNAFSTPLQIVALSPITPIIDPRTGLLSGSLPGPATNYPVYYNPLLSVDNTTNKTRVFRNTGNLYLSWNIVNNLSFRTEGGYDLLNQNEDKYYGSLTFRNTGTDNGYGESHYLTSTKFTTNNFLRYASVFNKLHDLEAIIGMSYEKNSTDENGVEAQQFPSDAYKKLNSAAQKVIGVSYKYENSLLSYFTRANYKYNNKYLAGVSLRYDGSSRFGSNNKYGVFPAGSLGWIISEENFLKGAKAISFLKLRTSYGLTGNSGIDDYASRGLWKAAGYAGTPGQQPLQIANPDLTWENTTQFDIGLDFGVLQNRINGEIDYYQKKTKDLLLNVPIPSTSGFETNYKNIGKMENKGFELVLNSQNLIGKFKWNTSLNFAVNDNKVTDLGGQMVAAGRDAVNYAMEGQPLGVFYLPEFAGADPANGDAIWYKNTQNADGTIDRSVTSDYNQASRIIAGSPNPDFIYGMTNNFNYEGFDLSITLQGVQGNKVYNGGAPFYAANGSNGFDNQTTDQLAAWQKPGDVTMVPEARQFFSNGTQTSTRYLQDASYMRIKNLTLGYNLPKAWLSRANISSIRLYVSALNLLTVTNYTGWDPEVSSDAFTTNIVQGYDFYSAPQARTYTFGINVGF